MLHADWLEANALTTTDPTKLIRLLAQQGGKPVIQRTYDLGPLLGALARTPAAAGEACLEAVLEEVETGPEAIRTASRAWARGDVAGALAAERTWERCIAATPGAQTFDARFKTDMAGDIRKALAGRGGTLAVVPLRPLLSEGGVLDRLPNLKICLSHAGGYLPAAIGRFDHGYSHRAEVRAKAARMPSSYLRNFHYDCISHSEGGLEQVIALVGIDRILLGTDFPADMGLRRPVDWLAARQHLGDDDRAAIQGGNASRLIFGAQHAG